MEDISFKIQLGVILPKITEEISTPILNIFDELVGFIKSAGTNNEDINKDEIKEILIRDFEIFLDKKIIPESQLLKEKVKSVVEDEQAEMI